MPETAATTLGDSIPRVETSGPSTVVERPARWGLFALWQIAGFDNRRARVTRFVCILVRPPIVSNTSPPVACELMVPPRTRLGALGFCVVGFVLAIAATLLAWIAPIWLAVIALPPSAVAAVVLIERGLTHFVVPADHIRLQDVVAQHRGGHVADRVLIELLSSISRPVALDVDSEATGVVALYHRLGFTATGQPGSKPGTIAMTRPAPVPSTSDITSTVFGVRPRWLWPSPAEIGVGVVAALAMCALHQPGTWSRHVVVATATFAVVTAARTDLRLHRIPNVLVAASVLPLLWIATGASITGEALVGAAIMAGPLLALNLATRGRSPGLGDIKLAAVAGCALGMIEPVDAPLAALMLTLIGGAIFGTIYQRRTRHRGFPLGPAIASATVALLVVHGLQLRNLT